MKRNTMRILALSMMLCILSGTILTGSVSAETTQADYYESRILELIDLSEVREGSDDVYYKEIFRYYSDASSADEASPDYVMAKIFINPVVDIPTIGFIGEYVVVTGPCSPYIYGYHIYVPAEDKVYTLEEAYNTGIDGIEEALKNLTFEVALLGDSDRNYKLDIKDVTMIQKKIAGIKVPQPQYPFTESWYIDDFNRDGERNIKDATAIQKKIAGLPY